MYLKQYHHSIINMVIPSMFLRCACSYRCGDALTTIAASTCFPEPFVTPSDRRRLGWVHKNLAGDRHSDHVALLAAYQGWEEARLVETPWV